MKKEYVRPELNILSLVVEDNINKLDGFDDVTVDSMADLGDLFG